MQYFQKNTKFHIFIIIILFSMTCSMRYVKQKPKGDDWEKCPICYGYGTTEEKKVRHREIENIDRNTNASAGSCLSIFASGTKQYDKYKEQNMDKKIDSINPDQYTYPESDIEIEYKKCEFCNGKGWYLNIK